MVELSWRSAQGSHALRGFTVRARRRSCVACFLPALFSPVPTRCRKERVKEGKEGGSWVRMCGCRAAT